MVGASDSGHFAKCQLLYTEINGILQKSPHATHTSKEAWCPGFGKINRVGSPGRARILGSQPASCRSPNVLGHGSGCSDPIFLKIRYAGHVNSESDFHTGGCIQFFSRFCKILLSGICSNSYDSASLGRHCTAPGGDQDWGPQHWTTP